MSMYYIQYITMSMYQHCTGRAVVVVIWGYTPYGHFFFYKKRMTTNSGPKSIPYGGRWSVWLVYGGLAALISQSRQCKSKPVDYYVNMRALWKLCASQQSPANRDICSGGGGGWDLAARTINKMVMLNNKCFCIIF